MYRRDFFFERSDYNSPNKMPNPKMSAEIIKAAILGFEEQRRHIDAKIVELRSMLVGSVVVTAAAATTGPTPGRKRRKLSAAARKRIAEAQRKRWAAVKTHAAPAAKETPKKKARLSAAGRMAIILAAKKRWAAVRAAKESKRPGVVKKAA